MQFYHFYQFYRPLQVYDSTYPTGRPRGLILPISPPSKDPTGFAIFRCRDYPPYILNRKNLPDIQFYHFTNLSPFAGLRRYLSRRPVRQLVCHFTDFTRMGISCLIIFLISHPPYGHTGFTIFWMSALPNVHI